MSQPQLPDIGVLALVPERFDVPWMSRHQILTRLCRYFPVVWSSPAPDWREALRGGAPARNAASLPPPSGLEVREPEAWLPRFHRPAWLERTTDRARLRRARRALVRRGARKVVLYVWRPDFARALDRVDYDLCLYHVVDEYSFSDRPGPIPDDERRLLERADLVIIHSPGLLERKGGINPNTRLLPNGVDFAAVSSPHPEPSDLAGIPRPRIGYCGWLKNQLDWDLLAKLAARHSEWSFVFVGGVAPHPELTAILEDLGRRPNVHLLGARRSDELMRYPAHFDVCMLPYRITAYTDCIYPLKLHEYLASGRPVVGTPIRTLREFADLVELAMGPEEWSAALSRALESDDDGGRGAEQRVSVARRHDWDCIAYHVARTIAGGLGPDAVARLDAIPVPPEWREAPTRGAA